MEREKEISKRYIREGRIGEKYTRTQKGKARGKRYTGGNRRK